MFSYVNYKIGYLYDMCEVICLVYENGVLVIWDLVYLVGVLLLDLYVVDVDYVIGCIYKYFNGGFGLLVYVWVVLCLCECVW